MGAARKSTPPAKASPKGKIRWMSQSEFARFRGVSRQSVSKDVKSGKIPIQNGMINVAEAMAALAALGVGAAAPNGNPTEAPTPTATAGDDNPEGAVVLNLYAAKAKRESYAAELARLEWRRRKGELVEAAAVKKDAYRAGRRIKARMLAIPARVDALIAAEMDPRAVRRLLVDEITKALEALTDGGADE